MNSTAQTELASQMRATMPPEAFRFAASSSFGHSDKPLPPKVTQRSDIELIIKVRAMLDEEEAALIAAQARIEKLRTVLKSLESGESSSSNIPANVAAKQGFQQGATHFGLPFAAPKANITAEAIRELQAQRPGLSTIQAFELLFAERANRG